FPDEYRWLVEMTSPTGPMVYLRPGVARPQLLDLMGVRYLLSPNSTGARSLASLIENGLVTGSPEAEPESDEVERDGSRRDAILEGVPSSIEAVLPHSSRARRFSFELCVASNDGESGGDLDCIVEAAAEPASKLVLSSYIDPRRMEGSPRWTEMRGDL